MREFIYFSKSAPTSGSYIREDLHDSGRLDIAVHTIIAAFFLSHQFREDVKLHLVFAGPPTPPRHLELKPETKGNTGEDKIYLSKSNVSRVIKKMLYKYREGEKREVFPGFWIEKKSFLDLASEFYEQGKSLYTLDSHGEDIREAKIEENPVFILGDHHGLTSKDLRKLKKISKSISIGRKTYFASHVTAIINNELDRREG